MKKIIQRFHQKLSGAQTVLITTHLHPDADGIGAQVALAIALEIAGKKVSCVNAAALAGRYSYLDPKRKIISAQEYSQQIAEEGESIDLLIIVDTNSLSRTGNSMQAFIPRAKRHLIIDHHPCPPELRAIHCIDTKMAATSELVTVLIKSLNITLSPDIALPLYTGIVIDTSSFRYASVSPHTHQVVSELLCSGIRPHQAYNLVYGLKKLGHMKLLGKILSHAQASKDERIAWLVVTQKLLQEYEVELEDTYAFINNLMILNNVHIVCMFVEQPPFIKVSLRAVKSVDVGLMAQALGGGGHNYSAGILIKGQMEEVVAETVDGLLTMLDSAGH